MLTPKKVPAIMFFLALFFFLTGCEEKETIDFNSDLNQTYVLKSAESETSSVVYSPEIFTRQKGKPVVVTREIEIMDYTCFSGFFDIYVQVGDETGQFSVSSAIIRIDDKVLWGPSDFNKKTTFLSASINLPAVFTLEVELRGTPGGYITLWIEGAKICFVCGDDFVDPRDGNVYRTVQISDQCWLAENLRASKYNDGTDITFVPGGDAWASPGGTGYYCWYNNDEATYKNTYGALYNWYAVETGKLSPVGWHIPSWEEFEELIDHLGGSSVAGGKLKETEMTHWLAPNTGATNESGFTGLPGGLVNTDVGISIPAVEFSGMGESGCYWSTTGNYYQAKYLILQHDFESTAWGNYLCSLGWSVRCVMD